MAATPQKRRSRSPLAIIFFTVFLDLVGFGIVIPILPLYAETYGASPAVIGLLLSTYSLLQFIMAPIWGRLSDRVGRRPVLLVALTAGSISYVLFGLAPSLPWLFIARGLAGASGGSISTAQAYFADVTPPQDRAKAMGFLGAAFGLGFIFGPAIGGVLTKYAPAFGHLLGGSAGATFVSHPMALPMFFAGFLTAANTIAAAIRLPESLSPELRRQARSSRPPRFKALASALRRPQLGALVCIYFLSTTGFSMMEATFALLAQKRMHMTVENIGWLFAFIGLVAVPVQGGLIGPLTRAYGEWRLLPTGLLLLAVGFIGVSGATSWTVVLIGAAIISVGNALAQPSSSALISKTAAAHEQGGTLGISQSAGAMARILGPAIGATLFGVYFGLPFYCAAVLLLTAMTIALATAARLREPQVENMPG